MPLSLHEDILRRVPDQMPETDGWHSWLEFLFLAIIFPHPLDIPFV